MYAAKYWWQHLRQYSGLASQALIDLAVGFAMTTGDRYIFMWLQIWNIEYGSSRPDLAINICELGPPLYYMAYTGILEVVSELLLVTVDVDARGDYGTALHVASERGYEKIVTKLLNYGADIEDRAPYHRSTALQIASREGHKKTVQVLLEHGADVNARGGRDGSALQAAVYKEHEQIVQMLLDRGANVNAPGGPDGIALKIALRRRHRRIEEMLLKHGARHTSPEEDDKASKLAQQLWRMYKQDHLNSEMIRRLSL